ncbi:aminotransferase class IV [Eubacterium pyruvativorans]|uniref:aminotransferase class IV n=1 Tax=Eubacterium pyruvativorans TaxID=155865 RepID=UPI0013D13E2F|nr:aminotransferase class IV [Eubacterium pyruvativorans]MCI5746307.1 aminotransferase class IV [Eubacterium pyruvativorans]
MKDHAMLQYFLLNGAQMDAACFDEVYREVQPSCYEVIRVINGKALFLEDHYDRFCHTLATVGQKPPVSCDTLGRMITELAERNGVQNYNVKVIYNDFRAGGNFYLFFTHTSYPTEEMYRQGVATELMRSVRKNPHAKIINDSLREQADAQIAAHHLFETILVDDQGNITEGSKSNIFFVRNGELVTSPASGVLLGVTRKHILHAAEAGGVVLKEEIIPADTLNSFDAAFISGTSPKVLPIARIGEQTLDVNDTALRRIMQLYDAEIRRYYSGE